MKIVFLACMLAMAASAQATECSARSGHKTAALVELYTSEGCSSCPPAERWLSGLDVASADAPLVALAFHVDYWDYIGWKDVFASPAFTERQRQAMRTSGGRYVYTPQVILSGRDLRSWSVIPHFRQSLTAANARPPGAQIELRSTREGDALSVRVSARLRDAAQAAGKELQLALTQSRLQTIVRAGENRGRTLAHDHVVRELRSLPLAGPGIESTQRFTLDKAWQGKDLAVVAFVQDNRNGEVLQALRLAACN